MYAIRSYYAGTPPTEPIYAEVQSMNRLTAKGSKEYVVATVSVFDKTFVPVADALVSGNFSGPTSESVSGTTNSSGIVEFTSRSVRGATGTWCLEITDVSKNGYEFTGPVSYNFV